VRDLVDQIVGNAPAADQAKLAADWAAVRDHVAKADADWAAGWQQPVIERLFPVAVAAAILPCSPMRWSPRSPARCRRRIRRLVQMVVVALSQGKPRQGRHDRDRGGRHRRRFRRRPSNRRRNRREIGFKQSGQSARKVKYCAAVSAPGPPSREIARGAFLRFQRSARARSSHLAL